MVTSQHDIDFLNETTSKKIEKNKTKKMKNIEQMTG